MSGWSERERVSRQGTGHGMSETFAFRQKSLLLRETLSLAVMWLRVSFCNGSGGKITVIFHFLATVPPEAQRVFECNITLVGSRERQQEPSLFSVPRASSSS